MKRVIIIGGGFAGSTIARLLEQTFAVTLIDTKNYFEFTPGILRTVLEPGHMRSIQALHNHYLHRATIIADTVIAVTAQAVKTASQTYPYDYLVIASGSSYNAPIKEGNVVLATRAEHLREYHKKLEGAGSILIIGGGLVGVELAAEIIEHYPKKQVTIAHAGNKLVERNNEKTIAYATNFLTSRGVKIRYNERVLSKAPEGFMTQLGNVITADLAFMCTGIVPNYEFMRPHLPEKLDERNLIKVNEALQVEGMPHVFAAGDINNRPVEKTAQNSERQAQTVAANIIALEAGKPLTSYLSKPTPVVISLGKWRGVFTYKKITLTGLVPGVLKAFIEKKEMLKYR